MKKSLIVLTAAAALALVGCSSNRGGTSDQQDRYSNGATENPNPNTPLNESGGPVRGPGTGGMGGTSTAPGGNNNGSGTSDSDTAPNSNLNNQDNNNINNPAPVAPDSGSQSQSPR